MNISKDVFKERKNRNDFFPNKNIGVSIKWYLIEGKNLILAESSEEASDINKLIESETRGNNEKK